MRSLPPVRRCQHERCDPALIHPDPPEIGQKIFFRWSYSIRWRVGTICEYSRYCYPLIWTGTNSFYLLNYYEWRPYSEEDHVLLVLAGEKVNRDG